MRRVLALLLILVVGISAYYLLSGKEGKASQGEQNRAVFLKLDKAVYTSEDTMTITIVNRGNVTITTSYNFRLYKLENGEWKEVPVKLMFIQVAVTIEPGKSWEQKVKLSDLGLSPGHYMIEKSVSFKDKTGSPAGLKLQAEFEVRG
ncbi:immunoglobulin-like domain-containing protein [Thermococcus sp.]|uniref:immunoglobulin-like domain-containing protein n=1 Tax=Thermococcus sp. TaxID=35749 RepID=UPI0026141CA5|nr:immunoglobulin-like domain-containing protein [Thermococcus sp.]